MSVTLRRVSPIVVGDDVLGVPFRSFTDILYSYNSSHRALLQSASQTAPSGREPFSGGYGIAHNAARQNVLPTISNFV